MSDRRYDRRSKVECGTCVFNSEFFGRRICLVLQRDGGGDIDVDAAHRIFSECSGQCSKYEYRRMTKAEMMRRYRATEAGSGYNRRYWAENKSEINARRRAKYAASRGEK